MSTIYTKDDWGTGWSITVTSSNNTTPTGGRAIGLKVDSQEKSIKATLGINKNAPPAFIGSRLMAILTDFQADRLLSAYYFDDPFTAPVFNLEGLGLRFLAAVNRFETHCNTTNGAN